MKNLFITLLILSEFLFSQNSTNNEISFESLNEQFLKFLDSPVKQARVDSILIKRGEASFFLSTGIIYASPEVNNNVHAMVFKGRGNFKFTPPDEIEKMQLSRFYSKKSLDENFNLLFLLFNDTTFNEINKNLVFTEDENRVEYERMVDDAFGYLFDEDEFLYRKVAYPFLEGKVSGLFYSHFFDNNNDPMFFEINPMYAEEFRLMRKLNKRFTTEHEIICQYSSKPDLRFEDRKKNLINGDINISKYVIESKIEDNLDFSANSKLIFKPKFDSQRWIILDLYSELEIDSIFLNKMPVSHYKSEDNSSVLIDCKNNLDISNDYILDFYYHGDLFEKNELSWISIKSPNYWFPRCDNWEKADMDLTYFVHENYDFCSVGNLILKEEDNEIVKYKYVSKTPIKNVSFNIGFFDEFNIEEKDLPTVNVFISEYGHNQIAQVLAPLGILSRSDMEEKIAADVVNSLNLFSHVYGKIPLENIYVTEIPQSHGEAFPGLVHIAWSAFQGIQEAGDVEQFIAHEVAHQWWGIQVDVDSYHDKWLSEAFAEYSGLWYVQLVLKNEVFFDALDDYKESIMNNRKYLFGSGQEAGPIWLGYRTHSSETEGDYYLIIYKKGAWVLHMLRSMLLDLTTMKEDRFENMMKEFFVSFSNKKATTKDFQKIVEKHFGMSMDWFFNQWLFDTSIPEYKFSYSTTKTPEGKYKVRCKVLQSKVPENFKSYVNLLVKFEGNNFARLRVEVSGNKPEFDLPIMPYEPTEIIFNDLNSVLCDFEYED